MARKKGVYYEKSNKIKYSTKRFVSRLEVIHPSFLIQKDNIEDQIYLSQLETELYSLMERLSIRERKVIEMRFGFEGKVMTLEEVGKTFMVTRERIRQIEMKAIRKLKHPDNITKLKNMKDCLYY